MNISPAGITLIKEFEGLRLSAYQDSVGMWTIGYGHTGGVREGKTITQEQADAFLRSDVAATVRAVDGMVKVPLRQGQFDALVSFAYNLGSNALQNSSLLRLLNAGDYHGASGQFGRWIYAGGVVMPGLVRRRRAEQDLFEGGK